MRNVKDWSDGDILAEYSDAEIEALKKRRADLVTAKRHAEEELLRNEEDMRDTDTLIKEWCQAIRDGERASRQETYQGEPTGAEYLD